MEASKAPREKRVMYWVKIEVRIDERTLALMYVRFEMKIEMELKK